MTKVSGILIANSHYQSTSTRTPCSLSLNDLYIVYTCIKKKYVIKTSLPSFVSLVDCDKKYPADGFYLKYPPLPKVLVG